MTTYHLQSETGGHITGMWGLFETEEQAIEGLRQWQAEDDKWYARVCAQLDNLHEEALRRAVVDDDDASDMTPMLFVQYPVRPKYTVVPCPEPGLDWRGEPRCLACLEAQLEAIPA